MPGGCRRAAALGVDPPGRPLRGIRYLAAPPAPRRPSATAGAAASAAPRCTPRCPRAPTTLGVGRVDGPVGEVEQDADAVAAAGPRARWLVAADGLHSPLRRALGLDAPARRGRPLRTAPALPRRSRGPTSSRSTGPTTPRPT